MEPTEWERMICQGTNCKEGCCSCGGFGYIFEKVNCGSCGQRYWERPGNYSVYEGKRFMSVDGLEIICHLDKENECGKCHGAK